MPSTSVSVAIAATLLLCAPPIVAQNLFANPGFELGNVSFSTDYSYSAGTNCCEAEYTVRGNGNTFNPWFVNPPAASPGSVRMMVVNGSSTATDRVWYQNVSVVQGETYRLRVHGCSAVGNGPAILQWQVGGNLIGAPVALPNPTAVWRTLTAAWTSPVTGVVEVALRDLYTGNPNDFYIDDVSMQTCGAMWFLYGTGFPGSSAQVPTIEASADPILGQQTQIVLGGSSPTPSFGLLVFGWAAANLPSGYGGNLLVQVAIVQGVLSPAAPATVNQPLTIPNDPSLCGLRIYAQFGQLDAGAAQGIAFSRGLELFVGT